MTLKPPTAGNSPITVTNVINVQDYGARGDGTTNDTASITAALAAVTQTSPYIGAELYFPPGQYVLSSLSLAGKNNIRLCGAGTQATALMITAATGNIFDFTGSSFCTVEDMSIAATVQRSAGALFYLDVGAGSCQRNEFRRLRISGGYRAFQLNNCTTTTIDEIQVTDYNATHPWHSVIHLSGTVTSLMASNVRGGSAATVTNGFVYVEGAGVDTVQFRNFDVLNLSPSTGMYGANVVAGEWIKFVSCSFEAGTTADGVVINGTARAVDLIGCHLLGLRGLNIVNGTACRMIGGEIVSCYQYGALVSGGTHHKFIGVTVSDVSQQANATYDGINIAPGVTDFTITDCDFGKMLVAGTNSMATAITVQSGASDRYIIARNRAATTGVVTPLVDAGTGTDKIVRDNVWAGSGAGTVTAAGTTTLPVNSDVVTVTGNTGITSITASYKGRRVTLVFTGTPTVTDGSNLKLAGNFVAAGTTNDADTLTLVCDGTNWFEVARSVN